MGGFYAVGGGKRLNTDDTDGTDQGQRRLKAKAKAKGGG
jgi:hypothetical protein